uniref:Uncharacterized protein n=1 Tax=Coptotermes formosanus TaxID=36987 RepID=R4V0T7_COPFO|nr:hypothetical protein [Coptotermes formosanus]
MGKEHKMSQRIKNPLRELQSISRDVLQIGYKKLPSNLKRVCFISYYQRAQLNERSAYSVLRTAELAKRLGYDIYALYNTTTEEYIQYLKHFVTRTSEFLWIYANALPIGSQEETGIPTKDGIEPPVLLYDILNCKKSEKILLIVDGIERKNNWHFRDNALKGEKVLALASYPDPEQDELLLEQTDENQENIFAFQLTKYFLQDTSVTAQVLATKLDEVMRDVGQRVWIESNPSSFASETGLI